jgi:UDP-N-acetylglucosamine enolpyruvyl transferase
VVHGIEFSILKDSLELAKFSDIAANVIGAILVQQVTRKNLMTARTKLGTELGPDETATARNKNPLRVHSLPSVTLWRRLTLEEKEGI